MAHQAANIANCGSDFCAMEPCDATEELHGNTEEGENDMSVLPST